MCGFVGFEGMEWVGWGGVLRLEGEGLGSWYILKGGEGGTLVWRRGRDGLLAIGCWEWGGGWWVEW